MCTKKELPACPVETTLTMISDKWKVLILRDLLTGTKRFGELKKSLTGVSQKVLTSQLREMEENGLVERKAYALLEHFFRKIVKEATGQDQPLYKVMEKMARTGRDLNSERTESRKIKVETTFDGTRVNPEKSGSITQICSENFTPEDFCYGVLKGMSTELYQMYMTIQKGTGIKIRRMIGSGNGLRKNPVLCEIIEDMFKAELVLAECEEEAATGAAMSSSMYNYSNSTR